MSNENTIHSVEKNLYMLGGDAVLDEYDDDEAEDNETDNKNKI